MASPRSRWFRLGPAVGWGMTLGLLLALASRGDAQSIGVDPYDPWNAMYRPFIFPTAPLNPGMPGQGRPEAISGAPANQFGRYLDSLGVGESADPFGRSGAGRAGGGRFTPYWQSNRSSTGPYDRTYQPNANDTFYEDQQKYEEEHYKASQIKDAKKRAEAIRKVEQDRLKALRAGNPTRSARAAAKGVAAGGRTAPRSTDRGRSPAAASPATDRGSLSSELFRSDPAETGSTFSNSETLRRSRAMNRARSSAGASGAIAPSTAPPVAAPPPALPAEDAATAPGRP